MLNKIKKIKLEDLKSILFLLFAFIPALILKIFKKNIWIIAERNNVADDNGWYFYKWMKKNKPIENFYFLLDKSSSNFDKKDRNMVHYGGFRSYIYYLASDIHINAMLNSTRLNTRICTLYEKYFKKNLKRIYLKHGIIKDNYKMFSYEKTKFRLLFCGSKPEYDYMMENAGYPLENLKYTGLARFDDLIDIKGNDGYILLIPTWRRYVGSDFNRSEKENEKDFLNSEYYSVYQSLINNEGLIEFLTANNLKVKFCIHAMFRKYAKFFDTNKKFIEITNESESIHRMIAKCSLLITDYSSVFFDAAYIDKPTVFYHFDYETYRNNHFEEGYFKYDRDGNGPVFKNELDLVNGIKEMYKEVFVLDEKYIRRNNTMFPIKDKNCCERIYKEIRKCEDL